MMHTRNWRQASWRMPSRMHARTHRWTDYPKQCRSGTQDGKWRRKMRDWLDVWAELSIHYRADWGPSQSTNEKLAPATPTGHASYGKQWTCQFTSFILTMYHMHKIIGTNYSATLLSYYNNNDNNKIVGPNFNMTTLWNFSTNMQESTILVTLHQYFQ